MRRSIVTATVAGAIAVTGAAFAVPALAEAPATTTATTTDGSAAAPASPRTRITTALEGLVSDGTITQAQSDEVATTLADQLPRDGFGGHHGKGGIGIGHVETAAAKALGISEADLRTQLQAGKSVADVAEDQGVDLDTVTTAVTDAAKSQIAQAVTDEKITQARADTLTANLDARVAEELAEVHDGGRRGGHDGARDGSGSTATPSSGAATS